jgi:hypothetical protein
MRYPGGLIATTPVNQQYPSGVWTGPQVAPYQANNVWGNDTSFKSTTLLLHGDGATTPFIKDASTNNFQIALNGDTKPNNLTPFIPNGYWSNYFDGTTDYLNTPSNAAFGMGTGDFTVETWIYFTAAQAEKHITDSNASGGLFLKTNATNVGIGRAMIGEDTMFSYSFSQNVWYHIAFSRSGSTVYGFVNGTQIGSATNTNSYATGACYVGAASDGSRSVNGYISNLRIVKGTAVYTSAFTPPTTPLTAITNTSLLTCQSNRFVDNSTNAFAITPSGNTAVTMQQPFTAPSGTSLYGSGYFDGTGDAIYSASQATTFGTGDFTLEFWVYFSAVNNSTVKYLYDMRNSGATTASFLAQEASNAWTFWNGAGSTLTTGFTSSTFAATTWNHVAICRSSGVTKFFVNGTQTGSVADTSNYANSTLTVGTRYTFSDGLNGYISNLRIVNGTAVYTAAFTPSTTPLTAVTNTSLLTLQTNGPENNNGFLDSSYNSFPITRNGNTTQGSFTPYEANGYWSNYFDGASYLSVANNANLNLSNSSFTIELWVYGTGTYPQGLISKGTTTSLGSEAWSIEYTSSSGGIAFGTGAYNSWSAPMLSGTITLNAWNHVAVVRNVNAHTMYINGVSVSTLSASYTVTNAGTLYVGTGWYAPGSRIYSAGYISNVRVVIGTAVYTSAFTPITTPLTAITNTQLLTCQSNRFVDNSSNAFTVSITSAPSVQAFQPFTPTVQYTPSTLGGSAYFDGSGDYLTVARNNAFLPGANTNFTFEAWIYKTTNSGADAVIVGFGEYGLDADWNMSLNTSNQLYLYIQSTGTVCANTSVSVQLNTWTHVAVSRSGTGSNNLKVFVNGVGQSFTSNATLVGIGGRQLAIGADQNGDEAVLTGYIADLRLINGSGIYTANFTPPTAPLTPVTNTQLLLSMTNAAIFDNSGMNNLETVGNAQIDTSVVKYGTSSMYFDGSGDYAISYNPNLYTFGTGDFTVEAWVYPTSFPAEAAIITTATSTDYQGFTVNVGTSGNIIIALGAGGSWTVVTTSGGTLTANTWQHIALTRSGNVFRMFVSGTQSYTTTNSVSLTNTNNAISVGGRTAGGGQYFNGYIDDLRVTKGVARYVTNFTPPVARMPNQ